MEVQTLKKKGRKSMRLGLKEVKSKTLLVNLMQNLREREATLECDSHGDPLGTLFVIVGDTEVKKCS